MSKTLILNFHPATTPSRVNAALARAVADLPQTQVVAMSEALDGEGLFDNEAEAQRLFDADRIVLQFPIQWYAPPALVANWQAQLLTYLFYIEPELGAKLEGKPVMVAATAGNMPQAYTAEGINGFPLEELLYPLRATAKRTGLDWHQPHLVYNANQLSEDELAAEAERYSRRITQFAQQTALIDA